MLVQRARRRRCCRRCGRCDRATAVARTRRGRGAALLLLLLLLVTLVALSAAVWHLGYRYEHVLYHTGVWSGDAVLTSDAASPAHVRWLPFSGGVDGSAAGACVPLLWLRSVFPRLALFSDADGGDDVAPRFADTGAEAYVTLLTPSSAGYVNSSVALAASLLAAGVRRPLVMLVRPEDAPLLHSARYEADVAALRAMGVRVLSDAALPFERVTPASDGGDAINADFPHWRSAYAKLVAWALTEYEVLFYLDADQVALDNLDRTFDAFAPAVRNGTDARPVVAAVLDPLLYPCGGRARRPYMLSSAMLLRPSAATFDALARMLGFDADGNWRWWDGDQQLLGVFFAGDMGGSGASERFVRLPDALSYFPVECECAGGARRSEVALLHFAWSPKPFQRAYDVWMYDLAHPARTCMAAERALWQWYVELGQRLYAPPQPGESWRSRVRALSCPSSSTSSSSSSSSV